ncbi:MAG: nitroreductase family protein [Treponema sp.]|nr:nitroreductase family protein [Treponema sp.]
MEFTQVVKDRYSCKKYSSKQVDKETIVKILEAGRLAPTAKNLQEQHIYVLQSQESLAAVDSVTPCRYGAPVVLAVAFDKNNVYTYPNSSRTSGIEDATIVATHLCLAAANEGVDNCWINNFDVDKLHAALGLPENEDILMLLDLGYAEEGFKPLPNHNSRKALEETVSWR